MDTICVLEVKPAVFSDKFHLSNENKKKREESKLITVFWPETVWKMAYPLTKLRTAGGV